MKLDDWEIRKNGSTRQLVHLHKDPPRPWYVIYFDESWCSCFSIDNKVWLCMECYEQAPAEIADMALLGNVFVSARLETKDPVKFLGQYEELKTFSGYRGGWSWESTPIKGLGGRNKDILKYSRQQAYKSFWKRNFTCTITGIVVYSTIINLSLYLYASMFF